ncbi:hypothetical protein SRHO_G00134550 [Serrasalmus rhombeus]
MYFLKLGDIHHKLDALLERAQLVTPTAEPCLKLGIDDIIVSCLIEIVGDWSLPSRQHTVGSEAHLQAWGLPCPPGVPQTNAPCYKPPQQLRFSTQTQEVNDVAVENMTPLHLPRNLQYSLTLISPFVRKQVKPYVDCSSCDDLSASPGAECDILGAYIPPKLSGFGKCPTHIVHNHEVLLLLPWGYGSLVVAQPYLLRKVSQAQCDITV